MTRRRKNLYKRGEKWYGKYKDASGRWRMKVLSRHLDIAEKKLSEIERRAELEEAGLDAPLLQQRPIEELRSAYLQRMKPRCSAEHLLQLEKSIDLVHGLSGVRSAAQISSAVMATVQRALTERGLSNYTVNKRIRQFMAMVIWAERSGMIARAPLILLDRLPENAKTRRHERRRLTLEEVRQLLAAAARIDTRGASRAAAEATISGGTKGKAWAAKSRRSWVPQAPLLEILAATGFRPREATSLTWGDLIAEKRGRATEWWVAARATRTKSLRERTNPIPEALGLSLLALRGAQARAIGRIPHDDDPILTTPKGLPWTRGNFRNARRWFTRVIAMAGLERKTIDGRHLDFYALRHTYCTVLQERGLGENVTATLMGHKTVSVTRNVYTDAQRLPKRAALDIVGEMFASNETSKTKGRG